MINILYSLIFCGMYSFLYRFNCYVIYYVHCSFVIIKVHVYVIRLYVIEQGIVLNNKVCVYEL